MCGSTAITIRPVPVGLGDQATGPRGHTSALIGLPHGTTVVAITQVTGDDSKPKVSVHDRGEAKCFASLFCRRYFAGMSLNITTPCEGTSAEN